MYQIDRAGEDRLNVTVSGKLDATDANRIIDITLEKARGISAGRMFVDIDELEVPTLGAFRAELTRMPEAFHLMRQFSRIVVLSDEGWVTAISGLESKLIPGLVIKTFPRAQRYHAETWLNSDRNDDGRLGPVSSVIIGRAPEDPGNNN